jgi:hypothetical protein
MILSWLRGQSGLQGFLTAKPAQHGAHNLRSTATTLLAACTSERVTDPPLWSVVEDEGWGYRLSFVCAVCGAVGWGCPGSLHATVSPPAHVCWQGCCVVAGRGVFVCLVYRRGGHTAVMTARSHTAVCEPTTLVATPRTLTRSLLFEGVWDCSESVRQCVRLWHRRWRVWLLRPHQPGRQNIVGWMAERAGE